MQTEKSERFVIVVGVDASPASTLVAEAATRLAKSIAGGELHFVHVLNGFEPAPIAEIPNPWSGTEVLERGREYLQQVARTASQSFDGRVAGHLATGEPWREIVQFAERLAADLVVVGSEGRSGLKRMALGSVSELVVRKAKCPVFVVRKTDYHMRDVPEIEPACPDCLLKQRETSGASLWCERHATHHPRAHVYQDVSESSSGTGTSSMLRP